ncbi:MAG: hypothetical protein WCZ66_10700 [Sphingomonadaceae bacterium]
MGTGKRQGNNPKRRIAPPGRLSAQALDRLTHGVRYVGSAHHKRNPVAYGFPRPEPRPNKSVCDMGRTIPPSEATALVTHGIQCGLFSEPQPDGFPKFIWSVSGTGEVFEAKTDRHGAGSYHGYPLEDEDAMREYVLSVWKERCPNVGP